MQVAPETELLRDYRADSRARFVVFAHIAERSRLYTLLAITGLGLALRLYAIGAYSFGGDEYNSLAEARHLGLNWNSIIYSGLLHIWMALGSSEAWLRFPAALFGAATIPLLVRAGTHLDGWRTGAVAGLLAATSPFNIFHSQEVRFYSLLMFATTAFVLATVRYAQSAKGVKTTVAVIAAGLLLFVSHFLGVIAIGAQSAATFLALKRRRWITVALVSIGLLILIALPLLPPVRRILFELYRTFGNAEGASTAATPISFVSFAKIGFAAFTFVFGYHVYPLRFLIVIPGALVTGFLIVVGIMRLFQQQKWAALALTYGVTFAGAFLILDSMGGRVATGVSPRHVAFVWPVFTLLLATGVSRFRRMTSRLFLVGLLMLNLVSLSYGWRKDWSYGPLVDYRAAADYAVHQANSPTEIVFPGRVGGAVDVYFPQSLTQVDLTPFFATGDVAPLVRSDRLIFISDDWEASRRRRLDRLLQALTAQYTHVEGRVDYPLFEYVLSRDVNPHTPAQSGDGTLQLDQPLSIYGLEFQDLKLPASLSGKGATVQVIGASQVPNSAGESVLTFTRAATTGKRSLVLFTNATFDREQPEGTAIAELMLQTPTGVVTIPLRLGIETAAWDQECPAGAACETVFHWHKRLLIAGQNSYAGAWRDFQAGIHAVTIDLPVARDIDNISVRYLASSGHLYVWAAALTN